MLQCILLTTAMIASSLQVVPDLDECLQIPALAEAMGAINRLWFDLTPADVDRLWPSKLGPGASCLYDPGEPCLQYETSHPVLLEDGTPLCRASFYWRTGKRGVKLDMVIVWFSNQSRSQALAAADLLVDTLDVPEDAIAIRREEAETLHQSYQWELREGGNLYEVSVLSIDTKHHETVWRSYLVFSREKISER
jgi:hypothetical protein